MRIASRSSSLILGLAALSVAQVDFPIGKDLDRYLLSPADTLYYLEEGIDSLPEASSPEFGEAIREWKQDPQVASVRVDTAKRLLHYTYGLMETVQRDGNVVSGAVLTHLHRPADQSFTRWEFDGQGRRIRQIFGDRLDGVESGLDTISYLWTREGCPDEIWADTKREWTVDADGRCTRGVVFGRSASGWGEVGVENLFFWAAGRLTHATEIEIDGDDVDTVAKTVFQHDGEGNWTKSETFRKGPTGSWRTTSRSNNQWSDGKFAGGRDTAFGGAGEVVWTRTVSLRSPTAGIAPKVVASGSGLRARIVDGALEFSNPDTKAMRLVVVRADGGSLADLVVPARGGLRWAPPAGNGLVVWSAGAASGKLLLSGR